NVFAGQRVPVPVPCRFCGADSAGPSQCPVAEQRRRGSLPSFIQGLPRHARGSPSVTNPRGYVTVDTRMTSTGVTVEWEGETERADDDRPIRQGDIVQWEQQDSPWKSVAVIVTADCDIAQKKHAGILSYVPIVTLVDYWRLITLPKKID